MHFLSEIISFLTAQQVVVNVDKPLPFTSVFPILFLPEHEMALHCISPERELPDQTDERFFCRLSDQAEAQQMRMIHLWEDMWRNQQLLVELRLMALFGKSVRVHARQTEVIRLNKEQTDHFLNAFHLQKTTSAYYKYGLIYKDDLVAVATFSKSRTMTDGPVPYRSYELVRFASQSGTTVTGGLSKLINHFIMQHQPAHLMTYADRDWSSGAGYKKSGFTFTEHTAPQQFLIHPHEMIRYYPHKLPPAYTSVDEMLTAGYVKIFNAGNSKFVLDRRKR